MPGITPHLWYDTEAREAAELYTSLFPDSKITNVSTIHDTPSGDTQIVSFELWGHPFQAISAGPMFRFNPSISFMVNFDPSQDQNARTRIVEVWERLSEGGKILMPLDEYPFSKRYSWVEDKYGLSWQLILTDPEGEVRPSIIPSLMFVQDVYGRAEEASDYYLSVFRDSRRGEIARYGKEHAPDNEGAVMFTDFMLEGQWFAAMDSASAHDFAFNEAISFMVHCDTQQEIDHYWSKLSAVPEAEQCGWLKDRYGVSWQIVPAVLDELMRSGDEQTKGRVTQAFLQMKKFDIAELEKTASG